ncbi:MAG: VCBS repeat-containing protein [Planctomycetota bacterium]|jgi:hypothetical protein|nr:VCBS repeat-containing protein [Planctomycetota bacterium]MDP6763836.1 VCBS repeat-containing protein [Planctomycetota bacterium]MDP6989050.1 VCBS repeat-containing protein [Planctomycetota bacterium]
MPSSSRVVTALSLLLVAGAAAWFLRPDDAPNPPDPRPAPPPAVEPVPADLVLPATIDLPDPDPRITDLETVEDKSELVADWLLDFSDKLRRRDFSAAARWFSPRFAGHSLAGLAVGGEGTLHADARKRTWDAAGAPIVDRDRFLAGIEELIGPWTRMESVLWKVKGAEFQAGGGERWGKIKLFLHMTGTRSDGGVSAIGGWAWLRVAREAGLWRIQRFQLTSLAETWHEGPLFTDVSAAAGVAHQGLRFGQPGNQSFAWNGAAGGDVDGDGLWDLFVPSDGRNFLYVAQDDGTYADQARERGVELPDAGTGAVFFDHDNDGDADLVVGHIGWCAGEEGVGGRALALYENDGTGHFEERSAALGLTEPVVAYSLTVFDYDGDGWLDVFACAYGRVAVEHNNSWIEANNGAPNALFRNLGGTGFEEVAERAGVRGDQWSYASAAADFDADGDVDLYVANDYGSNRLYRNEGDGTFRDVAPQVGVTDIGNGMGVSWGDLDADGRLDLYVANMSSTAGNRILGRLGDEIDPEMMALLRKLAAGNTIFEAESDGTFRALPSSAGGVNASWAWSVALCDFDLDGRLDVFNTNGFVTGDLPHDT